MGAATETPNHRPPTPVHPCSKCKLFISPPNASKYVEKILLGEVTHRGDMGVLKERIGIKKSDGSLFLGVDPLRIGYMHGTSE